MKDWFVSMSGHTLGHHDSSDDARNIGSRGGQEGSRVLQDTVVGECEKGESLLLTVALQNRGILGLVGIESRMDSGRDHLSPSPSRQSIGHLRLAQPVEPTLGS